ncbi:hypothetical protein [Methylobacterium sp. WCS2018Hpa-22]|uniref:hypothetical protein n=1 Tax=Methylobacterium sp. WCS2018Hpa-22 TaxID=3073633 RepID=UPI00288BD836|nr:hypothetical protein [Methylobacterium sp. WCS2018Hpa-22]
MRILPATGRRLIRYNASLRTVKDVISSSKVEQFSTGISATPIARRGTWRRWLAKQNLEMRGFVQLDWSLSRDEVLNYERWLFENLSAHRKYAKQAHDRHQPNASQHDEQCVYLVWWGSMPEELDA